MKLCYRGLSYDYDVATGAPLSMPAPVRRPFNLSYRGLTYTVDPTQAVPSAANQVAASLIYRGIRYTLNGGKVTTGWVKPVTDLKVFSTPAAARSETVNLHQLSIQRRLERRLQAAEAKGDQALVQVLRQEMEHAA